MENLTKDEIGWLVTLLSNIAYKNDTFPQFKEMVNLVVPKLRKMYSILEAGPYPFTMLQEMKLEPYPHPLQFSFEVKLGDTYLTRLQFVPEREIISYEAIQLLENAINQFYKYCMEKEK